MAVVIGDRLRETALELVEKRTQAVQEEGHEACAEFFEGRRTADLWRLSVEACGDLALLRDRLEHQVPLGKQEQDMLLNITEALPLTAEVQHLRQALRFGKRAA